MISFVCVGFIRMKEFYCIIVFVELHPEFASLNVQEKFVYLLRCENREVAKYLEKKAYNKRKYHL